MKTNKYYYALKVNNGPVIQHGFASMEDIAHNLVIEDQGTAVERTYAECGLLTLFLIPKTHGKVLWSEEKQRWVKEYTGVEKVAKIVFNRGDCTAWGAEENTFEACVELVKEVQQTGNEMLRDEAPTFNSESLDDLLRDELGLEPDYITDLWG